MPLPRIGNKAFEESYNRRIEGKHFVTENDIVPQVPFLWMGYGEYKKIELEGKGGWFIDHYPETYFQKYGGKYMAIGDYSKTTYANGVAPLSMPLI